MTFAIISKLLLPCAIALRMSDVKRVPEVSHRIMMSPAAKRKATIFCWAVLIPSPSELELAEVHFTRLGSFSNCDHHELYTNVTAEQIADLRSTPGDDLSGWSIRNVIAGSMDCKRGGVFNTWQNWKIFREIWRQMAHRFLKYDWTVKVDLDTYFSPLRLQNLLVSKSPLPERGLALAARKPAKYTGFIFGGFVFGAEYGAVLGAIEIYSQTAISKFTKRWKECEMQIRKMEEDWYMEKCMQLLDVEIQVSHELLGDLTTYPQPNYQDGRVAYHPLKDARRLLNFDKSAHPSKASSLCGHGDRTARSDNF